MNPETLLKLQPDKPDPRDLVFDPVVTESPDVVTLAEYAPPAYMQGKHDCSVHPVCAAFQMFYRVRGAIPIQPSRRFLYYQTLKALGSTRTDAGGSLAISIKSLLKFGVPDESDYPYNLQIPWKEFAQKPGPAIYELAASNRGEFKYYRVPNKIAKIKGALLERCPVMFGFTVPYSFLGKEIKKTGIFTWSKKEMMRARHAALIIALNDHAQTVTALNSFGPNWGQMGCFEIPYSFITSKHCSDFRIFK